MYRKSVSRRGVYIGREPVREWLAISSRINTWLFSLFRQTKQPFWNPNRPASPKFNLVFACGYIAKRQHRMFSTAKLRGSHLKAGRVYTHHTHSYVCIYHTYINKNPIPYWPIWPSVYPTYLYIRYIYSYVVVVLLPSASIPVSCVFALRIYTYIFY